jgi:hypothetical protein
VILDPLQQFVPNLTGLARRGLLGQRIGALP